MFPRPKMALGFRLTLVGRSLLLVIGEILFNVVLWVIAAVLFRKELQSILGLCLLAWTLGLRHALDADHISAIDNATRGLIGMGQLPVTCGLFFSLGHSTIVVVVNVAIAISSDVYDRLEGVGTVGGIVGAAVSGTFLFIVGLANSIVLYRILRRGQRDKKRALQDANDPERMETEDTIGGHHHNQFLMMRILGPVITFVDRPWKMYPVGVLFGFGFDTASSIALLAVSALAKQKADGTPISSSNIVLLPFLFTAGMTLIDSLDSILMLYSYSGFPERGFALFEKTHKQAIVLPPSPTTEFPPAGPLRPEGTTPKSPSAEDDRALHDARRPDPAGDFLDKDAQATERRAKMNMMSGLSIILTLLSILVAFSISLITIMGLIGDNCGPCQEAADAEDGGGLAGRWWRGWAEANDNSGYIGAAIVGTFVVIVAAWYGGKALYKRFHKKRGESTSASDTA